MFGLDPGVLNGGVEVVLIIVAAMVLVMNWRTQQLATHVISALGQASPTTERWSHAVTMLAQDAAGNPASIELRLAAVYSIEQIARESNIYRVPAMELLAAYVRQFAQPGHADLTPSVEVQSILTVMGRSSTEGLDLRRTVLWGVDLEGAHLAELNLSEARLRGACFANARLMRAKLRASDLADSDFSQADLSGAVLRNAQLARIDLTGAILRGADLRGADLRRARLRGADLRETILTGATFSEAVLDDADLTGALLGDVNLQGASLEGTTFSGADSQSSRVNQTPSPKPA